jgi:HNH endonuclease
MTKVGNKYSGYANREDLYEAIIKRDGLRCQYCYTDVTRDTLIIEHIVPEALKGPTIWENLVVACRPCNTRKSQSIWLPRNFYRSTENAPEWQRWITGSALHRTLWGIQPQFVQIAHRAALRETYAQLHRDIQRLEAQLDNEPLFDLHYLKDAHRALRQVTVNLMAAEEALNHLPADHPAVIEILTVLEDTHPPLRRAFGKASVLYSEAYEKNKELMIAQRATVNAAGGED